ncbi:MAG: Mor transcription activator family protein [Desulfobulbus sp.]|nr:Mor transcription activator family protein [Desulfobulbus sp.]
MKGEGASDRLPDMEHLAGSLKKIAEVIGVEKTVALSKILGGRWFYICGIDSLEREIRNRRIRDEYDCGGVTAVDLARKFGLSQSMIQKILSE